MRDPAPWLCFVGGARADDPDGIRRLSSGKLRETKDPVSDKHVLIAEGDVVFRPEISESCRVVFEIMLGSSRGATLDSAGDLRMEVRKEKDDDRILHLDARMGSVERHVIRGAIPDYSRWTSDKGEIKKLAMEFEKAPDWSSRWMRLGLDISSECVSLWVDGRFISQGPRREGSVDPCLKIGGGGMIRSIEIIPLPDKGSPYLALDIVSYVNSNGLGKGDLGDGFAFPSSPLEVCGMVRVEGLPFHVRWEPENANNIDLGKTCYRGRLPYVNTNALSPDQSRVLLRVPKGYYQAAHVICTSDTSEDELPAASVRMIKCGRGHAVTSEFEVPAWDQQDGRVAPLPVGRMIAHKGGEEVAGNLWLISVPLNPCQFQEFLEDEDDFLEIDLARRIALDEESFPHPAGPPSSVHIFALTLEAAAVKMVVRWRGIAPVYELPDCPALEVELVSQRGILQDLKLNLRITDPYGRGSCITETVTLQPWQKKTILRRLPQKVLGKFDLVVRLESMSGDHPLEHATSFVLLPKDTRRATDDSPFGMWCFFEVHLGLEPAKVAPLMRMAGVRWTLPGFLLTKSDEENAARLKVLESEGVHLNCGHVCCIGNSCCEKPSDPRPLVERMTKMPELGAWLVFWETFLSPRHRNAFPLELLGRPPMDLDEEEERHLRNCWRTGIEYSKLVRSEFPGARLVFGNGFPSFIGAMMKEGYPKEYLDAFGLDFDLYTSMPERQPGALYAPFSNIYILRALQKIYSYEEFPIYLTEAIYSPAAPGWLSEREQADYYVRSHLLALAGGVIFFGMCTSLYDPGDEYFYSHYGPIGLLRRPPELIPRESFCAYSTMTRVLDGAHFAEIVPMDSTSVFALRFERGSGESLYALWTIRGRRQATIIVDDDGVPTVTDLFGNEQTLKPRDGRVQLELTSSPIYLKVDGLTSIDLSGSFHEAREDEYRTLVAFDDLSEWMEDRGLVEELEALVPSVPMTRGRFQISTTAGIDGRGPVARIELSPDSTSHPLQISYVRLLRSDINTFIPQTAEAIGAWVRGNSSWGRILFDLVDAGGKEWISTRAETFIDFDGWRRVEVPLPKDPDSRNLIRTGFREWVCEGSEDGPVYPMKLKGIILEARSHVIYADSLRKPTEPFYCVEGILLRMRSG